MVNSEHQISAMTFFNYSGCYTKLKFVTEFQAIINTQLAKPVQNLFDKFSQAGNASNGKTGSFKFPLPPTIEDLRLSPACISNPSDVANSKKRLVSASSPRTSRQDGETDRLPPIGVFWDIENCQIPHGKSALTIVQAIRNEFFDEYREAEFTVVCDVHKESPIIIQELNDAQVDLLHVISISKNAADEKLRQAIRRFADLHGSPSAVVLISSDINFAPDLSDLRHRKKIRVILLHSVNCSESLIMCANEHYSFSDFVQPLPNRNQQIETQSADIFVWNLPMTEGEQRIKCRLKTLSQNCGGRIIVISRPMAVLRFPTLEMAVRAQKRMDGELVFGQPIRVGVSHFMNPPVKMDSQCGNRSRGAQFNSYSNGGQYSREPSQSSFLPINPNPWIFQNGSSFQNSDVRDKYMQPSRDKPVNGSGDQFSATNSSWGWGANNDQDRNGGLNRTPSTIEGVEKLSLNNSYNSSSNAGVPGRLNRTNSAAEASNVQKGWNTTPTFTTAYFDSRDWLDSSKKRLRSSPITNTSSQQQQQPQNNSRKSLDSAWNPSKNVGGNRKCRTPSPYMFSSNMAHPLAVKPNGRNGSNNQGARYPQEGYDIPKLSSPVSNSSNGVELHVANLDQNLNPSEMKKIVSTICSAYVMVLHVAVFIQADQSLAASVRVATFQDAQLVISRLHRKKIGFKKIVVSFAQSNQQQNIQYLKWQIISLLQDVPQHTLPLFKFLEVFEARYVTQISVSELFKLKDVCTINDENGSRVVTLNPTYTDFQSLGLPSSQDAPPYCSKHYIMYQRDALSKGWAEQEAPPLPNILVPLDIFSANIEKLLASHNNVLPLASLFNCYNAECEQLNVNENGVPLEHYVTCVPQVELAITSNGVKYLCPNLSDAGSEEKFDDFSTACVSPSLTGILHLSGREIVDLLKTQPHCQLLFNKFIPAYHHHFGRQCRVADYGYTKLIDLLESVPQIVQVIGEGAKRIVTLSHLAQIRRFTFDLLKTLKSHPMKRLSLDEVPSAFEKVFGRPFDPVDYGMCTLNDLVKNVPQSSFIVYHKGSLSLSMPKKEQNEEEVQRTKQFAQEVVELLSHAPKYSIHFEKFIPAYHHHFSHQCKVGDFGFTKLIELFEAIPDTVQVSLDEDLESRRITLTAEKKLLVLSNQMIDLVYPCYPPGLPLNNVESRYLWYYGYALSPLTYNARSLEDLMNQLDSVKVVDADQGKIIVPLDGALLRQTVSKVRAFLISSEKGRLPLVKLRSHFSVYHEPHLTPQKLLSNLPELIQLEEEGGQIIVGLTPLYQLIRKIVKLILANDGRLQISSVFDAYYKEYQKPLITQPFGFASVKELLEKTPNLFVFRGKGSKRQVHLSKELSSSLQEPKVQNSFFKAAICRPPSATDTNSSTSEGSNGTWFGDDSSGSPTPVGELPEMQTPLLNEKAFSLFPPCKGLLPFSPFVSSSSNSVAPDPSELPIPNLSLGTSSKKEGGSSPSYQFPDKYNTFGFLTHGPNSNCSASNPGNELTSSGSGNKRKTRLAAQFNQPLDIN